MLESGRLAATETPQIAETGVRVIKLTQGKVALVDTEDFERVSAFKWYAGQRRGTWYAFTDGVGKTTAMHRLVLNAQVGEEVDHRNNDGLDNTKRNLRVVTHTQNLQNRRPSNRYTFKGVSYHDGAQKYRARITKDGKQIHLGFFVDDVDAAKAYDEAAKELFGEHAQTNF